MSRGAPWMIVVGSLGGLQLRMSLVGPMSQTSTRLEFLGLSTVDLNLNIDLVQRLGTSVLQTHYC